MLDVNIGVIVIAITALGYVSNFLNWRFLDYAPIRALYYVGALVHETSHAIACILTGARIEQFTVFSNQPQVVHRKSRLPILGELIISAAPIAGGLLFLFLVNRYALGTILRSHHSVRFMDGKYSFLSRLDCCRKSICFNGKAG